MRKLLFVETSAKSLNARIYDAQMACLRRLSEARTPGRMRLYLAVQELSIHVDQTTINKWRVK